MTFDECVEQEVEICTFSPPKRSAEGKIGSQILIWFLDFIRVVHLRIISPSQIINQKLLSPSSGKSQKTHLSYVVRTHLRQVTSALWQHVFTLSSLDLEAAVESTRALAGLSQNG
jgi:hypothetical protein